MAAADLLYVKANYPILDLVHEVQVDLYGAGASGLVQPGMNTPQKTRCPVHDELNPSAKVYPESNSVYCWVCGRTWDPPGLLMAALGITAPQAVRRLLSRMSAAPEEHGTRFNMDATRLLRDQLSDSLTPEAAEAWRDAIHLWALEHGGRWWQLDEVAEACSWTAEMSPGDSIMTIRRVIEWCRRISPEIPDPPVEGEFERFLLGVS